MGANCYRRYYLVFSKIPTHYVRINTEKITCGHNIITDKNICIAILRRVHRLSGQLIVFETLILCEFKREALFFSEKQVPT